ncbi:MAG: nitrous oxide reductase accessory protein NosL [Saprospiraceae bacterium]|nr:nitrous oxide reductase accessory protein NosL [Saprospiraceae bacterium]
MATLSKLSKYLLVLAGICILGALYFPIWRIELDAPQYPEGLSLLIYANRLAGDVEIINGLNRYIGMKTLHAEEFIEFKVLSYIIGFFGLWALLNAFLNSKRSVLILLICFAIFGALAMYDFWRWEYEYGHNLDPTAAIIVPGMAYQPPLIGFKQLLNFGAFSIPDVGGWLLLTGGVLIALVYGLEAGFLNWLIKPRKKKCFYVHDTFIFLVSACEPTGPEPIVLNEDTCSFCKMTISDGHFGAELITEKGRCFKFDDISCLIQYRKQHQEKSSKHNYVHDYLGKNELIQIETAYFIKGGDIKSPMAGNTAAFRTEALAMEYQTKLSAEKTDWNILNK